MVSVKFVNELVILKRETSSLEPRPQGNGGGHGKLAGVRGWIKGRITEKPDLTLDDLVPELIEQHNITVHRVSVWRVLRSFGLSHKKDLQAAEQKRPEVWQARHLWITQCQPFMRNLLSRIGFIDETALKTNMAKTTGWSAIGTRLSDHVPFGHWKTQTFIAALRHNRLEAPGVIEGAMNAKLFDLYVETQLAPTLQRDDVIILDNLSSHKPNRSGGNEGCRRVFFIPAALQPRSQSHHDGLFQTQGFDPSSSSTHI